MKLLPRLFLSVLFMFLSTCAFSDDIHIAKYLLARKSLAKEKLAQYCDDCSFGGDYRTKVWQKNDKLMIEEFSIDKLYCISGDQFFCRQARIIHEF